MDKELFWKNFSLGKELDVAGCFIYNGIKLFDSMEYFYYEEEIFEFLYNIAVGIERLEKIAYILLEYDEKCDKEKFREKLKGHSHIGLMHRIYNKKKLNLKKVHYDFLKLLTDFYKNCRYDRFNINLDNVFNNDKEKVALIDFLSKHLNISIKVDSLGGFTKNDIKIKEFLGNVIGDISLALYNIIQTQASSLNIYTDEIRSNSKASKIFQKREFSFKKENLVWREILIYFLNYKFESKFIDFVKHIEPLELELYSYQDYLKAIQSDIKKMDILDEIEVLYTEINDLDNRYECLEILTENGICFDGEEDEDDLLDKEIEYSDIAKTDEEFWEDGEIVSPHKKVDFTIMIDEDLAIWLKAMGQSSNQAVNNIIRAYFLVNM